MYELLETDVHQQKRRCLRSVDVNDPLYDKRSSDYDLAVILHQEKKDSLNVS